jgi:hypothetical protein
MRTTGTITPSTLKSIATSYFTYTLGRDLYVPLTSKCNSLTLPQLRGTNFTLPSHVVAALCRVRDSEATDVSESELIGREQLQSSSSKWSGWCSYLDTQDGHQKLPPPDGPSVHFLIEDCTMMMMNMMSGGKEEQRQRRNPQIDDLFYEVQQHLLSNNNNDADDAINNPSTMTTTRTRPESIVLSGEGEPTLRWDDMLQLSKKIHDTMVSSTSSSSTSINKIPIRLTTNGLLGNVRTPRLGRRRKQKGSSDHDYESITIVDLPMMVQSMVQCGISKVSVGLMTNDPQQYDDIVLPQLVTATTSTMLDDGNGDHDATTTATTSSSCCPGAAHEIVCQFIQEAVQTKGLEVETTAIARDDVDKALTEALSQSLGVMTPVRWRPYFP